MRQLTWPTCILVYIQRQQTSRQFDTVTSKDFVLAFGVLPICIYVKRPRTSQYSRVTFVLAFSILTFCVYLVKRPRTSHHSRVTFVFLWSFVFNTLYFTRLGTSHYSCSHLFCDYYRFVLERVASKWNDSDISIPYGNIALRALVNSLTSLFMTDLQRLQLGLSYD